MIDDVEPGRWKFTFMFLDKKYTVASPSPFTIDIEED